MIIVTILVGVLFAIASLNPDAESYYHNPHYNLLTIVEGLLFIIGLYIYKVGELYMLKHKKEDDPRFIDEDYASKFNNRLKYISFSIIIAAVIIMFLNKSL